MYPFCHRWRLVRVLCTTKPLFHIFYALVVFCLFCFHGVRKPQQKVYFSHIERGCEWYVKSVVVIVIVLEAIVPPGDWTTLRFAAIYLSQVFFYRKHSSVHSVQSEPTALMCTEHTSECPVCGKRYLVYVEFCRYYHPPLLRCLRGIAHVQEDMEEGKCPSPVCPYSRTGGCIVS
ncbi:hypothetical protein F4810DRAFT_125501 [Camillea tinctor]|nr:hypothetical protein F4810DRAFT_125501 [Camillea tinctor]